MYRNNASKSKGEVSSAVIFAVGEILKLIFLGKGFREMKEKLLLTACIMVYAIVCGLAYGELAGVGETDPTTGFPSFYQDTDGVNLVLGINNPTLTFFDPVIEGNAFSAQVGFGAEAFYWAADSTIELPGGGNAILVLALEAAWAGEEPVDGDQMVFGRVRIRIDVTTPGTYTVVHPFGTEVFPNVQPGIRAINMTRDIGVTPLAFQEALTSDIGPFLIAVTPAPPAGFVGDPGIAQTVAGSPTGNNFFRIIGPDGANLDGLGSNEVQSNLFSVQGELAEPNPGIICTGEIIGDLNDDCKVDLEDMAILQANMFQCNILPQELCFGSDDPDFIVSPTIFDYGTVAPAASSVPKVFTIQNIGAANITTGTISITGVNTDQFGFTDIDTDNAIITPGETASFTVTFSPTTVGDKTAIVQIPFGVSSTATINLSGRSGLPDIASDLTSKDFGEVSIGDSGTATQVFTITNAGNDDLSIGVVGLTGINASEFVITVDNCSNLTLLPGASCTLTVAFNPTSPGAKTASISIPSDDPDENPFTITLTGSAILPVEVVIDNTDGILGGASSTGTWLASGGINPFGIDSVFSRTAGDTFMFSADLVNVQYAVFMRWTTWPSRFTNVPVQIHSGATLLDSLTVNQQLNGSQWILLGIHTFDDTAKVTITAQDGGSTNADAVQFVPVSLLSEIVIDNGQNGTSSTGTWLVSGGANPFGTDSLWSRNIGDTYTFESVATGTFDVYAWWTVWPSRDSTVPVDIIDGNTVIDTVIVNQTANGGQWNLLGTYDFNNSSKVRITSESTDLSTNADAVRFVPQ